MENKDEKTFADLFSSSELKENEQPNLEDNNKIDNIQESENNNFITFDDIFDNVIESENQETEEKDLSLNTEVSEVENKNEIENSNSMNINSLFHSGDIFSEKEDSKQLETPFTNEETKSSAILNPLFENEKSNSEINNNNKLEIEQIKEESPKDLAVDNPFFEEKTEENPFFEDNKNVLEPNNVNEAATEQIKEESPKDLAFDNPFFEEKTEENPFFEDNKNVLEPNNVNEAETEQIKEESPKDLTFDNPFFEEKTEENPFFEDNKNVLEPNNVNEAETEQIKEESPKDLAFDNPFFEDNKNGSETNNTNEAKAEQAQENEIKSTSPFFEEKKTDETNPFFENQLNLIENKNHDMSNGTIDTTKTKHFNVKVVKKKEPLLKFILGVFSYAIFIFLLLIGITLLIYVLDIKIRAAKGDYSAPTFNAYVVLTGSMLPEIEVNDVVITKKVDAEKLKEKDIITFASADSRFQGTIITHRIIKKNPPDGDKGYTFQTKGDNNNVADSALVPEQNIYGKVILKIPKLGYLQEFLASDGGWIIVILIPCLTVISYDIVKLAKGLKRKKYKNIKVQK